MASAAFWNWVNSQGLIPNSDPNYYSSGQAAKEPGAYENAIKVAIQNVKNKPLAIQQEFFQKLQAEGGMSAESNSGYYAGIAFGTADMNNLIKTAGAAFQGAYGEGATTQALPRNAKLVKVGNQYRVVWDLGQNLGHAWYSISDSHLQALYGSTTPQAHITLSNTGQFDERFKGIYWGDAAEITLKAETPWEDLANKMNSQFGYVPGLDDPEIQRLLRQSFFEGWTQDQWVVEYRKTQYFQKTTDQQRQWVGLSKAEQDQRVNEQRNRLASQYLDIWGKDPNLNSLSDAAFKIASGQMNENQWLYEQRTAAGAQSGTPEWLRREQQKVEAAQWANRPEDLGLFAENQYRAWVGPGALPANFAATWGANLASGKSSEADLERYLKQLSQNRWAFKPPDLTWQDWAAGYKADIASTLELGSIDDNDTLLNQILRSDLTGVDLQGMIRQDERFKSTQKMYDELSGAAAEMGRRFGFIT